MSNNVNMNTNQASGGPNAGQSTDLFDELHRSFIDLFAPLRCDYENTPNPNVETYRAASEHSVPKFADHARAMELYFVRWRTIFGHLDPNELIKEEIAEMESEIRRKDATCARIYEKLDNWKALFESESLDQRKDISRADEPMYQEGTPTKP
ncbi:mediator of RNA polymerase II transcription subunit 28-like [Panonychus citri]|uniref:mediator of RNA polymerase II transcription subunit 28-like n=1 Tax=Panonychus citri TaxID=50023 RepID=UPI00230811B9|nr:mediator of RNA polymerase II transcription subunit 28-like [Panonychus citri]